MFTLKDQTSAGGAAGSGGPRLKLSAVSCGRAVRRRVALCPPARLPHSLCVCLPRRYLEAETDLDGRQEAGKENDVMLWGSDIVAGSAGSFSLVPSCVLKLKHFVPSAGTGTLTSCLSVLWLFVFFVFLRNVYILLGCFQLPGVLLNGIVKIPRSQSIKILENSQSGGTPPTSSGAK